MEIIKNVLIENLVQVACAVVLALIAICETWITVKLGKKTSLQSVNEAQKELWDVITGVVADLQQNVVEDLKAAAADGKLSRQEIHTLNNKLIAETVKRLSPQAAKVISAAGKDLGQLILTLGEKAVLEIKQ